MCDKETLVKDGLCKENNECQIDECDFCINDAEGKEQCMICESDYSVQVINGQKVCVKETDETENCEMVNDGKCVVCDINHYMSNGICIRSNIYSVSSTSIEAEDESSTKIIVSMFITVALLF